MFDWFSNPELPDFERIDLVIGVNNKVLFVGTDFHWQEYWYAIGGEIPQIDASITKYVVSYWRNYRKTNPASDWCYSKYCT